MIFFYRLAPTAAKRVGSRHPMGAIDDLLERLPVAGAHAPPRVARPALRLAVLTCMDARIDVHRILGWPTATPM